MPHASTTRRAILVALAWFAVSGAALQTSDELIGRQVTMRLGTDAQLKGAPLDVTVLNGVVVIKGTARTKAAVNRATRLARGIKGVRTVRNELVVAP